MVVMKSGEIGVKVIVYNRMKARLNINMCKKLSQIALNTFDRYICKHKMLWTLNSDVVCDYDITMGETNCFILLDTLRGGRGRPSRQFLLDRDNSRGQCKPILQDEIANLIISRMGVAV